MIEQQGEEVAHVQGIQSQDRFVQTLEPKIVEQQVVLQNIVERVTDTIVEGPVQRHIQVPMLAEEPAMESLATKKDAGTELLADEPAT
eukprot:1398318-Heterocapsa_arctica.AAC.1